MNEIKNEPVEETVTEAEPVAEDTKKQKNDKEKKESRKEDKKLREENEALHASLEELNDRYTRMLAEYDNFRKRAQKEREGVYADAVGDVLSEILTIKDTLEMAMAYADDSKLSQGVTMTLTKFTEILQKLGVEEFGAVGDEFDPNLHNAIFHVEDESLGENVIAEVLLKGYKKGDKIIRYAMVKVAN
ncbi:MAG: nucleotide exchange factor GrpE [Ruminococcaceae bacterium]|nr:nucleotide exchange factor GrpE [Oscillospiraceae bacterium]